MGRRVVLTLVTAASLTAAGLVSGARPVALLSSPVAVAGNCVGQPQSSAPSPPSSDPFYSPPSPLPAGSPGTVIAWRPVCLAGLEMGLPFQAWQIMYLSTGVEDSGGTPSYLDATPVADIATVILPLMNAPVSGPMPLVSYQTAEDADSELSAPSYTLRFGFGSADTAAVMALLAQGDAVVVPDYEGLRSEYGAGVQAGHAVLDGIRAAEGFGPARLGGGLGTSTPVGMWGYSGGAIATGWAAELAAGYAPAVHMAGIAEGGVPADIRSVVDNLNGSSNFAFLFYEAAVGSSVAYPNLFYDEAPNPGNGEVGGSGATGFATVANQAGQQLASEYQEGKSPSVEPSISSYTWCGCNPIDNAGEFPGINVLLNVSMMGQPGHVPDAPVYVYEAYFDELVPFAGVQTLVNTYCSEGVQVTFHVNFASEHVSEAVVDAASATEYLQARLRGLPVPSTCGLPYNGGAPDPPLNTGSVLKGQLGNGSGASIAGVSAPGVIDLCMIDGVVASTCTYTATSAAGERAGSLGQFQVIDESVTFYTQPGCTPYHPVVAQGDDTIVTSFSASGYTSCQAVGTTPDDGVTIGHQYELQASAPAFAGDAAV